MEGIPEQLVADFLSGYRGSNVYSRDRISRLSMLATADDPRTAEAATRALFTGLVEPLADSFEPDAVSLYNRAFAQVIQACRPLARAAELDQELADYGLASEDDLVARAEYFRKAFLRPGPIDSSRNIKRLIVLSRVTLGADVAITSVIIERLKLRFTSEIVLVGGHKTPELFGGDSRLRFEQIGYSRTGTTIERLLTWIDLLRCVRKLTSDLTSGEYLIFDPDSRLTQLGLLPVDCVDSTERSWPPAKTGRPPEQGEYLFFPSREYGCGTAQSLSELTSTWLDQLFGESVPTHPRVCLRKNDVDAARNLVTRLKRDSRPIVAINFGVGENQLKRVGGVFEAMLVKRLVQEGALIVFDKGAGPEEISRANSIVAEATCTEYDGRPLCAVEFNEQNLKNQGGSERLEAEILVWNGPIGMLGALIGESDLYIGYDSAGQHIAAALGVKCIDVCAGFSSLRMLERWRPTGSARTHVVAVDVDRATDANQLVAEIQRSAVEMLKDVN